MFKKFAYAALALVGSTAALAQPAQGPMYQGTLAGGVTGSGIDNEYALSKVTFACRDAQLGQDADVCLDMEIMVNRANANVRMASTIHPKLAVTHPRIIMRYKLLRYNGPSDAGIVRVVNLYIPSLQQPKPMTIPVHGSLTYTVISTDGGNTWSQPVFHQES